MILTTAPAGLGHVRVTEALRGGLGEGVRAEVLGLKDPSLQVLHRLTSRNQVLRGVMEFVQNHYLVEKQFTRIYIKSLRKQAIEAYLKIRDLAERRRPRPKTMIIVATHFSLAHQLAEVKERLIEELKMRIVLVVVVTDDSPQKIWGVVGADYIFVPSDFTRDKLMAYLVSFANRVPQVIVSPYPISRKFDRDLTEPEFEARRRQVEPGAREKMQVIIPISGAAVQLKYFQELILALGYGGKADITVVARDCGLSHGFLSWCQKQVSVRVVASDYDREVVAEYEREYERNVFAVEITKPSEQAFKALTTPDERGGVALLFSDPVGRQEDDNLAFLARHGLVPSAGDRQVLERLFGENRRELITEEFRRRARSWRGMMLPTAGWQAGEAVLRLRESGILAAMADFAGFRDEVELHGDGVRRFWRELEKRVEGRQSG